MTKPGFEFLKIPLLDKKDEHSVDYAVLNLIVDEFIEKGGNFFDTSITYLSGASEEAIRLSITERFERDSFILSDKLPSWLIRNPEDCRKIFEKQLSRCGVDFFDIYMLQWINEANYLNAEFAGGFKFLEELKAEGKIKKSGFSFHDSPELLDRILEKHPEVDFVQLQINYPDWESPAFRSMECYKVAEKHGKKIIASEPFKNGKLKMLPAEAKNLLSENELSEKSAAVGFIKNLPMVKFILFGAEDFENSPEIFEETPKLSEKEISAILKTAEILRTEKSVPCIGCSGCSENCPVKIPVHRYFEIYNEYCRNPEESWKIEPSYSSLTRNFSRPSDCMRCRLCEGICPQNINITETLQKVSRTFGY